MDISIVNPVKSRSPSFRRSRVALEPQRWFCLGNFGHAKRARWRRAVPVALMVALSGCLPPERPVVDPIPIRIYGDIAASDHVYVLLPGLGNSVDTFANQGFVDIGLDRLEGRERAAFVAVDAHMGYFRDADISRRIKDEVVGLRLAGKRVTAVGISLGGLGVLMTARRHPRLFERIVLIAPFLGWGDDIARLKSGSEPAPTDKLKLEVDAVWRWLADGADGLPVALLYGRKDKFRDAYAYLAQRAPSVAIHHIDGRHNWRTWNTLWSQWLTRR